MYFVAAGLVTIQQHMTDGSPKSGLPVDLVGTLSDGCEPYSAFLALKKLDNHLGGHGLLEFASLRADHTQEACRALLEANAAKPKPSDDPRKLDLTVPGANTRSDRHNYDDDGLHIEDVRNWHKKEADYASKYAKVTAIDSAAESKIASWMIEMAAEGSQLRVELEEVRDEQNRDHNGVRRNVREGQDP